MKGILLHTLCHILPRASIPHDRNCAVATIRPHKQPVHSLNSVGHWPSTHFLCVFARKLFRENPLARLSKVCARRFSYTCHADCNEVSVQSQQYCLTDSSLRIGMTEAFGTLLITHYSLHITHHPLLITN